MDMHLFLSETLSLSVEIAPAGHFSAHFPQDMQADPAFGTSPDPDFLYGLLLGTDGLDKSLEDIFFQEFDHQNFQESYNHLN